MPIELRAGSAAATILQFGGRLHRLVVPTAHRPADILEAPRNLDDYHRAPFAGGSFPMAPWPNRVAGGRFRFRDGEVVLPAGADGHALHGLLYAVPWSVLRQTHDSCELQAHLAPPWPWPGTVVQRFSLEPHALRLEMAIDTAADEMPAGGGWHPWFRRSLDDSGGVEVDLPASRRYVLHNQIPTGAFADGGLDGHSVLAGLDDCFVGLAGPITLRWPGALALTMEIEAPAAHVQVYTTATAICVEPQSCPPDAFNMAARGAIPRAWVTATPGQPMAIASTWRWEAG